MTDKAQVTSLINAWRKGEDGALDDLIPFVYDELRRLARHQMQDESSAHTLQATALVHEAFLRLADVDLEYKSRAHFHAMAARTMRRILVDHARRKNSEKRGGGIRNVTLEEGSIAGEHAPSSILDLDQALDELTENDEQLSVAVELVFFGGLSYDEAADSMNISRTSFAEDLRMAKAWLKTRLCDE
jgi:RNA polymerase sigma factor (TIGR02999 family)